MEVSVAEAPLQLATYACDLPTDEDGLLAIETTSLRKPRPCLMKSDEIDADDEEEQPGRKGVGVQVQKG